jgi:hypothetical protein
MNRSELERLDRDTLIARAESSGVSRARILTRPELVDELLLKTTEARDDVQRVRGFFGRARDLLARVVERGLHLPDAADRLRGRSTAPLPFRSTAAPLPTVTLAEIYAAQGHRDRAVETLRNVIEREPEHAAARGLLDQLEDQSYEGPRLQTLPPEEEPSGLRAETDETPAPPGPEAGSPPGWAHDVDECVAIPVDPETLFVYWEIRDRTRAHFEATRQGGRVALRMLVISATWEGPVSTVRDLDVEPAGGDVLVGGLPAGAVIRAAIGWRDGDTFIPMAHSPPLEAPESSDASAQTDVLVRWTPRGATPLRPTDRDAASIERALGAARARALGERADTGS